MAASAYTIDQVALHNKESDAWIAIKGNVYDVTKFIGIHPGGRKIILKHIGTDATKEWLKFHNPQILDTVAKPYLIGKLHAAPAKIEEHSSSSSFGDLIPYADPAWYQDFHSPYYQQSHRDLRQLTRHFVDTEIMPFCHEWDEAKTVPRDLYLKAGKLGLLQVATGVLSPQYFTVPLPAHIQPKDWSPFHEFVVCDELCRCGSGGVVWALIGGLGIGLPPIIMFGSEFLKAKVLPNCYSGTQNICLCVTEPHAGSDVANIQTEARLSQDKKHYILNGEKKWITNGAFADYFTVVCRTGGKGMGGISLLLVEKTMRGVTARPMQCSGMWASGTGYITFEDVHVPVENLIGKENQGFKYLMKNFNHERMGIVIQATRFARVCFEEAIKHASTRRTFGKKLIEHDVIRHKLANMAHRIETVHSWMESLMYQSVHMSDHEQMLRLGGPIALLKAASTQMFEFVAREAAQIFGGLCYTRGGKGEKVERLYREVRAYAIPGGSEEIMLDLGMRQSLKVAQVLGAKL